MSNVVTLNLSAVVLYLVSDRVREVVDNRALHCAVLTLLFTLLLRWLASQGAQRDFERGAAATICALVAMLLLGCGRAPPPPECMFAVLGGGLASTAVGWAWNTARASRGAP